MPNHFHLNPVAANLVTEPAEWEISSYPESIGQRSGTLPDPQTILRLVGSADAYRRFVEYGRMTPRSDLQRLWIDDEIS